MALAIDPFCVTQPGGPAARDEPHFFSIAFNKTTDSKVTQLLCPTL